MIASRSLMMSKKAHQLTKRAVQSRRQLYGEQPFIQQTQLRDKRGDAAQHEEDERHELETRKVRQADEAIQDKDLENQLMTPIEIAGIRPNACSSLTMFHAKKNFFSCRGRCSPPGMCCSRCCVFRSPWRQSAACM